MPPPARYWDSCTFLAWLSKEAGRVDECQGVLRQAESGNVLLVTSSLTLTEVIKLKGSAALPETYEPVIQEFFKHRYIVVRQLDRFTAEYARELIWKHGFDPKDSVHIATAIRGGVKRFDTFDEELIKHSGQIGDLIIGHPDVAEQLEFTPFEEEEEVDDAEDPEDGSPQIT